MLVSIALLVATAAVAAGVAAGAGVLTAGASSSGSARYLLALGDSLASGYQPTDRTSPPPDDPADGLPDQGYPGSYAADLARRYGLRLVDLACPGETTSSFSGTPAEPACAAFYASFLHASSQQAAAGNFLDAHRGQVALVTFDLGANDLDPCAKASGVDVSCLAWGEADIVTELPPLLGSLSGKLTHDDPGATIAAMNYYDPFLALAFSPGGGKASAAATASVSGVAGLNTTLDQIDRRRHVLTANVAAAFDTYDLLPLTSYGGMLLPRDVASICELTWMCPLSGTQVAHPDIHPRLSGYRAIAGAFESTLAAHHVQV